MLVVCGHAGGCAGGVGVPWCGCGAVCSCAFAVWGDGWAWGVRVRGFWARVCLWCGVLLVRCAGVPVRGCALGGVSSCAVLGAHHERKRREDHRLGTIMPLECERTTCTKGEDGGFNWYHE